MSRVFNERKLKVCNFMMSHSNSLNNFNNYIMHQSINSNNLTDLFEQVKISIYVCSQHIHISTSQDFPIPHVCEKNYT